MFTLFKSHVGDVVEIKYQRAFKECLLAIYSIDSIHRRFPVYASSINICFGTFLLENIFMSLSKPLKSLTL